MGSDETFSKWTSHPNRASNATYTIHHTDGSDAILVNQQGATGQFNSLGVFTLDETSTIQLTDEADGYVIADAVKLVRTATPPATGTHIAYYHTDHLGTPQVLTDESQNVVWEADYEPFGQANITTEVVTNNLRFPGQYFDQETGLSYNYLRYYDPQLGRFITSDRTGIEAGTNTYSYVSGNPLIYFDPNGLDQMKRSRFMPSGGMGGHGPFGPVCGPEGDPIATWIPDGKFTKACANHDKCYDCSGRSRTECDNSFCEEMLEACREAYNGANFGIQQCQRNARLYCRKVREGGDKYFRGGSDCEECN